ncbi:uncharacterized protein Z518_01366 [Rhinocladiella mackenziei CBS 650.93]|uniref:Xylanolytic transcriptional activator regulatory domain-containing protein n=1 Tax=Rhinocladiella mackenziei CBS 650.93 TaxID=1442369 RepID=A0A0D2IW60_9EURO|nr:uncharacterized protein Z518_01366 [Rhinocladiella mackenziei CBS 650.93]KIX10284.1 hypothetical protein Z518_01366 [Rhinocladiella mackenziei CBS 650.93]
MNCEGRDDVGRRFYRRCQELLTEEIEGPSITALQCHIFSVIYLTNASFYNTAHSTLALAIRAGVIVGLHLEPSGCMPASQREFRKRLWWTLYALEMKAAMELGRPLVVNVSQVTCNLPKDDKDATGLSDSTSTFTGDGVTGYTWNLQFIKLILAARSVYITFCHKCAEILRNNGGNSPYNDPQALEVCAEYLLSRMDFLQTWLHGVPESLKIKRKGTGELFSTDRSPLDLKSMSPFWLHRHKLLLEFLYHNLSMNLYRPFICFFRVSDACTKMTDNNAMACVNHAVTITQIIHQIPIEGDVLDGWHEILQWQWNAILSLVGYILTYPLAPSTPSARKALSIAIRVFELLESNVPCAANAASVARDLSGKADFLVDHFRSNLTTLTPSRWDNGDVLQKYGSDFRSPNFVSQLEGLSPVMVPNELGSRSLNDFASTYGSDTFIPDLNWDPELSLPWLPSMETNAELGWNTEGLELRQVREWRDFSNEA